MSGTDVGPARETLLQPELFQFHLTAFFRIGFPFTALLIFLFYRRAGAGVLKLYFRAHRPAFAKIVAQIDDSMGNVETSVARVMSVLACARIAVDVVAVEIAAVGSLTVSTYAQAVTAGVSHHRVSGTDLSLHGQGCKSERQRQQAC